MSTLHTLLSEHWHAVRFVRPRLRTGVQVFPRRLRGRAWLLLHDPATQKFVRITPELWQVLELCDGTRTLDDVWQQACLLPKQALAAAPLGQNELVKLLGQLYAQDLLQSQVSPDAAEVFARYKKQQRTKWLNSLLNPLSLKWPLFFPDAWFERQAGLAKKLFSLGGLGGWLAIVLPALVLAWTHWTALTTNLSDRVLSSHNLLVLWLVYPLVKAVHEWAHGLAVKAWGGRVREVGLLVVMFTPVPYVDASSSYRFPAKWARAAVAAAGIMAELLLGAVALYIWLNAEPGVIKALAFNVVLIAGFSTLVVNGNPFMRYDGYFILCDLIEMPNLAQRATQYWVYLADKYLFGAHDASPPNAIDHDRPWLFFYGLLAPIYRLSVTLGMIWFVAGEYFFIGVLMALAATWTALCLPLWRAWKHVHSGPSLAQRRDNAQRRLVWASALVLLTVLWLPLPFYSVHEAVVWLPEAAIVRAQIPGHVVQVHTTAGQMVPAGTALLNLDNPSLMADWQVAQAQVESLEARLRATELHDPVKAASFRHELAVNQAKEQQLATQAQAQFLKAGLSGRWMPAAATELTGRYIKRGEIVGYMVNGPSHLVRVVVTQEDMNLIRTRLKGVQTRLAQNLAHVCHATVSRQVPGGSTELLSAALGLQGGGEIAVDPAQTQGTKALQRVFDLEVQMADSSPRAVFGDRAYVRFDLGYAPLAWQGFLRLQQLFLSRFYV